MGYYRKHLFAGIFSLALMIALPLTAGAQSGNTVTLKLEDSSTGEEVEFATVSLTPDGAKSASNYSLSDDVGKVSLTKVKKGTYLLKTEILGYKSYTKTIKVDGAVDLGTVKLELDKTILDAATVSATGNPIIIKKDTIEYNASSFKTTDNDMLEDLLKKLPGVEVSESGSITVNGETISKITIDGKTFFLDDPQLASKNIPAKIINKVKVVAKKSEQAEFTGIDDGNEETVIDLSVRPGMMNGLFGNANVGGGHDVPESGYYDQTGKDWKDDGWRYQGAAFVGKFTDKSQVSLILNANNTNNQGFNDLAGSMMQSMRGGGGGMGRGSGGFGDSNGITTSWMGGLNGSWDLFGDKMELGANYLFNGTKADVEEKSNKITYLDDGTSLNYNTNGFNRTNSYGHRFGARLEHKFSENTSIIFQPEVIFGNGNFSEYSDFTTLKNDGISADTTNVGFNRNTGDNSNWKTNGFFLFRQRLGIPGRTLSFMANYSFSNNDMNGFNQSLTRDYLEDGTQADSTVNQRYDQNQKNRTLSGRLTYTEPLGGGFYLEGSYELSWNKTTSYKNTFDSGLVGSDDFFDNYLYNTTGEAMNSTFSNNIVNRYVNQRIGADFMYQKNKLRAQVGFNANPTYTHNETNGEVYDSHVVNWAPEAMLFYDITDNENIRLFYMGRSSQPSTTQLMPVPDNTDPLNVSFGDPYLKPYFSHSLRSDYRYSNKKTFATLSLRLSASLVNDPIVNATWYSTNGAQYSIPVNGPTSGNVSLRSFYNSPIAKSNFSVSNMFSGSYSKSSSYVGSTSFPTGTYYKDGEFDYELFHTDYPDLDDASFFTRNDIQSMSITERLRGTFRNDLVELQLGGRTRLSKSWYTVSKVSTNMTRNNQLAGSMNWTIPGGLTLVSSLNYNWYKGYSVKQDDEYIVNAEVSKLLFKSKCTLALKVYDLFNESKNLSVSDASNYHTETWNNTLGRYAVLSMRFRFGNFNNASKGMKNGRMGGGPGGHGGPPPMM